MNPKENDNVARILFLHCLNDDRAKLLFVTKGDYSLKNSLHFLYREAIVDVRGFARMDFIMYFGA